MMRRAILKAFGMDANYVKYRASEVAFGEKSGRSYKEILAFLNTDIEKAE